MHSSARLPHPQRKPGIPCVRCRISSTHPCSESLDVRRRRILGSGRHSKTRKPVVERPRRTCPILHFRPYGGEFGHRIRLSQTWIWTWVLPTVRFWIVASKVAKQTAFFYRRWCTQGCSKHEPRSRSAVFIIGAEKFASDTRTFDLYRLRPARERLDFRVFLPFKVETDEFAQQPCLSFLYSMLSVSTSIPYNFDLTPILGKLEATDPRARDASALLCQREDSMMVRLY